MVESLLSRQVGLLEFLTSGAAIFPRPGETSRPGLLRGFDGDMLCLEARFSHDKRMEKIKAVLPKTTELLGGGSPELLRRFVDGHPPAVIGRLANAQQFHEFLCAQAAQGLLPLPYLHDVAACELACARARTQVSAPERPDVNDAPVDAVRRLPGIIALHCEYDVRSIFEGGDAGVEKRDSWLVVAMAPGNRQPEVHEVGKGVFDLVAALDDWADATKLGMEPESREMVEELVRYGIVEVRGCGFA